MRKVFDYEMDDIILVSGNERLKNGRQGKAFHLNPDYKQCKEMLTLYFRVNYRGRETITGPVKVDYTLQSAKDFDNILKVINDSLKAAGVIKDDGPKNIVEFSGSIIARRRGKPDYLRVRVWEL